ncbi:MAG: hypothetical protein ACHRXM_26355 [Isosphaerales bacterium]
MTTETTMTTCKKCNATLTNFDARFCQGYCKACYNGTPLTDDEDNGMTPCDGCEAEITDEWYEANDGLCPACLAETFVCRGCEGRTHRTGAHSVVKTHCETCGDELLEERRQARHDKATEEARELLEAIIELDDLDAIFKAVKALKKLQPPTTPNPEGAP